MSVKVFWCWEGVVVWDSRHGCISMVVIRPWGDLGLFDIIWSHLKSSNFRWLLHLLIGEAYPATAVIFVGSLLTLVFGVARIGQCDRWGWFEGQTRNMIYGRRTMWYIKYIEGWIWVIDGLAHIINHLSLWVGGCTVLSHTVTHALHNALVW